ncbi:hypothetical protein ACIQGZ_20705 [Streptomyces sp. NPDC092296]|uniref:hypothetical protein n=1 Tax=Streptomyces sp. NPDC092296 TaxID=3366012 RepID=UPI00380D38B0
MSQDSEQGASAAGSTNNSVSDSTVNGPIFQVRTVYGGMHVHDQPKAARPPGPDAVEVLVEQHDPVGRYVVLPALDAITADPPVRGPGVLTGGEDIAGWARDHGGIDFGHTVLFVTLTNRSDAHLTLRGIRAEVLERDAPPTGALIGKETAGSQSVPELTFDLDRPESQLWEVDEYTRRPIGTRPYLDRTHVRLAPDESLKLIITAEARRYCCAWQLSLTFRPDGAPEFTVQPPDRFRTTGLPVQGLAPVLSWRWSLNPPRFIPRAAHLDWCRVGHSEPRPLNPLPEGARPPFWARHPNILRFRPALIHFIGTDTDGPELDRRLKDVDAAMRAVCDGLKTGDDTALEGFPAPLQELVRALLALCAGLAAGHLPAEIHDALRHYIERTPAAVALGPVLATVERVG